MEMRCECINNSMCIFLKISFDIEMLFFYFIFWLEIAAIKNINSDGGLNPSPSIKCRLAHLALDINTSTLLSRIYEADPSMHTLELWKVLALDYVNNPMWQPRRVVNDDRLHDIGEFLLFFFLSICHLH